MADGTNFSWKDKVAIITGGAGAIGSCSAIAMAQAGARIAVVDSDESACAELVKRLQSDGIDAIACPGDVADLVAIASHVEAVMVRWGRVDVLVTAAGVSCGGTVTTTSPSDWAEVLRVNLDGTWLWCRAVLPIMQAQRQGAIVTVTSQLAIAGGHHSSAYIASKGAVLALSRTMAVDYAPDGIRVNAVAPGATDTPMLKRGFARAANPEGAREVSRRRHAMQRFARPEEVAQAVLFLAADAASFVTGVVLPVDGGWLAA